VSVAVDPRRAPAAPAVDHALAPVLLVRLLAAAALGGFGAVHWAGQVGPRADGRLLSMLALALAGGLLLRLAAAAPRRVRAGTAVAVAVGLAFAALLTAGFPARLLGPTGWGDLASEITNAIVALPGVRVPYRGVDETIRSTILLGGTALLALGAVAALWPAGRGRSRAVAAVAFALLYAVPATEADLAGQFGRGVAFAGLLAAFLLAERVRLSAAGLALVLTAAALLTGLAAARAIDRSGAPLDYHQIASSLERRGDPNFDWSPTYGPIRWSRDDREVLRVRARRPAYWKAENLDGFDGLRWGQARQPGNASHDAELPTEGLRRPAWVQTVRVRITGMRSQQVLGAGTTLDVARAPVDTVPAGSPGTYVVDGALHRGDSYLARVYVPNPTAAELRGARTEYPESLDPYRTLEIPNPARPAGPTVVVTYPWFGDPPTTRPLALEPTGLAARTGARITAASVYGQSWALARRLRDGAATPYDYVRAVESYLGRGFRYTESPPVRPVPLESFLFRDRKGYCQHFSGAMALLLRMGGVPARVTTGFAPGTLDRRRGEYVVRDLDAHSWVEAWFAGYGWVPFDPTPSDAPAASQAAVAQSPSAASPPAGDRADPGHRAAGDSGGGPRPWLAGAAVLLVALAVGAAFGLTRAARERRGRDPVLAELERALERTGRPLAPGTTLARLEARFAGSPGAAAYLRALREARYGGRGDGPTRAQRAGLRRELARGLGPAGRLRALWALPPVPPGRFAGRGA
jgi:transglutaminase-like putative cysteine protease